MKIYRFRKLLYKALFFNSIFNDMRRIMNLDMNYDNWVKLGKPFPVPANIKRQLLIDYKNRFNPSIFLEAGKFDFNTTNAMKDNFGSIFSIEVDTIIST